MLAVAWTAVLAWPGVSPAARVPFGGNTYDLILDDHSSWPEAQTAAAGAGGRLATITSAAEQAFIESLLVDRAAPSGAYWFGLQEVGNSNVFQPLNGETSTFTNFDTGEPNNGGTVAESVGSILWSTDPAEPGFGRRGEWNDLPPGGYPDPAFITDSADLMRTGYLVEFNGGGNPIPIPPAVLAFPLVALIAFAAGRRMIRA